jgi:hypothetical protein
MLSDAEVLPRVGELYPERFVLHGKGLHGDWRIVQRSWRDLCLLDGWKGLLREQHVHRERGVLHLGGLSGRRRL